VGRSARDKGKRGELDLAHTLADLWGRAWRRSASQSQGRARTVQEPDVVLVEPASTWEAAQGPEVKRTEAGSPWAWMAQAREDSAGTDRVPWVACRGSRQPWQVWVDVADLRALAMLLTGEDRWGLWAIWVAEGQVEGHAPRWRALWSRRCATMAAPWIIWTRTGDDGGSLLLCRLRDVPAVADHLLGEAGPRRE